MRRFDLTALASVVLLGGAIVLGGCASGVEVPDDLPGSTSPKIVKFQADSPAGLPIAAQKDDESQFKKLVASTSSKWGYSRDPFALMPAERKIDAEQTAERIVSSVGFSNEYTPPEDEGEKPVYIEQQPYRRLSGVIIGDSVMAIIDMGNGKTEIVRPGQKIPNSVWTVVSIDEDKAVLSREGSVQPKRITVRLESLPGGVSQTGGFTGSSGMPFGNGSRMGAGPGTQGGRGKTGFGGGASAG